MPVQENKRMAEVLQGVRLLDLAHAIRDMVKNLHNRTV